jgi:hypothetical protein
MVPKQASHKPLSFWVVFSLLILVFLVGLSKIYTGTRCISVGYSMAKAQQTQTRLEREHYKLLVKLAKTKNINELRVLAVGSRSGSLNSLASNR